MISRWRSCWLMVLLVACFAGTAVSAQDEGLRLRLSRDFGFGAGTSIEGTFSFRVDGPDDLERVEYLIDGEVIAADSSPPWRHQFKTGEFALGTHTLSAVGYTSDGRVLESSPLVRQFVPASNANIIVIGILALVVIGLIITTVISRRTTGYGPFGAAVCPNCERPYGIHLWSLNLAGRRFDRCPHCGKWRLIRRATAAELAAAEAATVAPAPDERRSPEEELRRRLDDSRFDDAP